MGTNWLGGLGVKPEHLFNAIDDRLPYGIRTRHLKFVDAVYSPYYRKNLYHFTYKAPNGETVHLEDFMAGFPSDEFIGALLLLMYDGQQPSQEQGDWCKHGYTYPYCPTCHN